MRDSRQQSTNKNKSVKFRFFCLLVILDMANLLYHQTFQKHSIWYWDFMSHLNSTMDIASKHFFVMHKHMDCILTNCTQLFMNKSSVIYSTN